LHYSFMFDPKTQPLRLLPNSDPADHSSLPAKLEELAELESDQELLLRFVNCKDRTAIEHLISRQSPMVIAVCRATTSCPEDAQDAFQATFLVLLQSAHKIRRQASLVAWLHGVAYRISCRIRLHNKRTATMIDSAQFDSSLPSANIPSEEPLSLLARKIELEWLFRELEKLPTKLKCAIIEHYLHGYTAREISERMEISVSAVEGRLRRGRRLLRSRLMRYGLSLSVAFGTLDLLKVHLSAAEVSQWSMNFKLSYLITNEPSSQVGLITGASPKLQALIRGESSMLLKTLLTKSAVAFMAFGTVGSLISWAVWAADGVPQRAQPNVVTLALAENAELAPPLPAVVLPPTTLAQVDNEQNITDQPKSGAVVPQTPTAVEWNRPEGDDPSWLKADESTIAIEARIDNHRQTLKKQIQVINFQDTPLSQVVSLLAEEFRVALRIDLAELEVEGVDPDSPVTLELPSCSLRELLDIVLKPLNLTYRIRESWIEITTEAAVEASPPLRSYDLSYLCSTSESFDAVVSSMQTSIEPDGWQENGGTSTISNVGSLLIVKCPDRIHYEIESFLRLIAKMNPDNTTPTGDQRPLRQKNMSSAMGMSGRGGGVGTGADSE
jgi:RNA polymerase sigma factor (sigma-70 family)